MPWHVTSVGRLLFPGLLWKIPTEEKIIYLTFDDGPTPEITDRVLAILGRFDAKATFFCLGKNAEKYPDLLRKIISCGHRTGCHTYSHKNGWKTKNKDYHQDIAKSESIFKSSLFRPPYGKITLTQARTLKKKYTIVMWDVLSRDYNKKLSGQQCADIVITRLVPGSIVVFHDSVKAEKNLLYALPVTLEHFSKNGYRFEALPG